MKTKPTDNYYLTKIFGTALVQRFSQKYKYTSRKHGVTPLNLLNRAQNLENMVYFETKFYRVCAYARTLTPSAICRSNFALPRPLGMHVVPEFVKKFIFT